LGLFLRLGSIHSRRSQNIAPIPGRYLLGAGEGWSRSFQPPNFLEKSWSTELKISGTFQHKTSAKLCLHSVVEIRFGTPGPGSPIPPPHFLQHCWRSTKLKIDGAYSGVEIRFGGLVPEAHPPPFLVNGLEHKIRNGRHFSAQNEHKTLRPF